MVSGIDQISAFRLEVWRLVPLTSSQMSAVSISPVSVIGWIRAIGVHIYRPAFPREQDMDPSVPEAHPGMTDIPDPLFQSGLVGSTRGVSVGLGIEQDRRAGAADRDRPVRSHRIDQRSLPTSP